MIDAALAGLARLAIEARPSGLDTVNRRALWKRLILPTVIACVVVRASPIACQQATPSPAKSATLVQIENTNATFSTTDVDIPQANPARPTVTIPAHLPPTGYLQFEQGAVRAGNSPGGTNAQFAVSEVVKLALTTRLLVQFLSQPYTRNTVVNGPGSEAVSNDPGDLQAGFEYVVHKSVGALPTVSIGFIRRVRSGTSANLDVGDYSQTAILILGGDLREGFHYDSNILFNEQNTGPVRRPQFQQTLAVSHALFPSATKQRLSGTIEPSHATQPFVTATSSGARVARGNSFDLLFVGAYALRPNLIFDASVDRGLTSTSTHWQGGFGLTYLLPHRLWKDTHPVPIRVGGKS